MAKQRRAEKRARSTSSKGESKANGKATAVAEATERVRKLVAEKDKQIKELEQEINRLQAIPRSSTGVEYPLGNAPTPQPPEPTVNLPGNVMFQSPPDPAAEKPSPRVVPTSGKSER
jgi:hypothetical protein